jgi:putative component of toxin-antitoxin plasmid stabilization module
MPIFTLRSIDAVRAKQELDELMLDDVGQLEAFREELAEKHERYLSELGTLLIYMEYAANGQTLPATKFKDVTPDGESVKEYEFKSKHLRVYAIKKPNGKIIVLGGLKTTQKADFKRFRSLKKQYLKSLEP